MHTLSAQQVPSRAMSHGQTAGKRSSRRWGHAIHLLTNLDRRQTKKSKHMLSIWRTSFEIIYAYGKAIGGATAVAAAAAAPPLRRHARNGKRLPRRHRLQHYSLSAQEAHESLRRNSSNNLPDSKSLGHLNVLCKQRGVLPVLGARHVDWQVLDLHTVPYRAHNPDVYNVQNTALLMFAAACNGANAKQKSGIAPPPGKSINDPRLWSRTSTPPAFYSNP